MRHQEENKMGNSNCTERFNQGTTRETDPSRAGVGDEGDYFRLGGHGGQPRGGGLLVESHQIKGANIHEGKESVKGKPVLLSCGRRAQSTWEQRKTEWDWCRPVLGCHGPLGCGWPRLSTWHTWGEGTSTQDLPPSDCEALSWVVPTLGSWARAV